MDKLKKMQKNGEITEDDLKYGEKEMQDITDKFVKEADSVAAEKEKNNGDLICFGTLKQKGWALRAVMPFCLNTERDFCYDKVT